MVVVIFEATVRQFDNEYTDTAKALREEAKGYGCSYFSACTEGDKEIAISHWPDIESVKRWKVNPLHQEAQKRGKEKWYSQYKTTIAFTDD